MSSVIVPIIVGVLCALIFGVIGFVFGGEHRRKTSEKEIGSATQQATKIINNALNEAEATKKARLVEAKDEIHKLRHDADKEIRERRTEVQKQENRLNQREEYLDKRADSLEKKNENISVKQKQLDDKLLEIDGIKKSQFDMLERISGLTQEQAKDQLLANLNEELDTEKSKRILENEQMIKDQSDVLAKEIISTAIQRCAADHTAETTVSVVALPNDEMKGRIIGREGRNIRSIETITGVELIIDDTPEAITISSFDPVRREIARLTLEHLIQDGRIHPTKIEECFDKATREVNQTIKTEGEKAVLSANCGQIHPELVKLLGKLKYRTSYGQSVLKHSLEVSYVQIFRYRQSSSIGTSWSTCHSLLYRESPMPGVSCTEIGAKRAQSFIPSQFSHGKGARQRFFPVGGAANGTPRKAVIRGSAASIPRTRPFSVFVCRIIDLLLSKTL